jgi:hypothetical protein
MRNAARASKVKTFLCLSLNRANYSVGIALSGNSVMTSKTSKSLSKKGDQDLRVFSKSGLEDSHFSRFFAPFVSH